MAKLNSTASRRGVVSKCLTISPGGRRVSPCSADLSDVALNQGTDPCISYVSMYWWDVKAENIQSLLPTKFIC